MDSKLFNSILAGSSINRSNPNLYNRQMANINPMTMPQFSSNRPTGRVMFPIAPPSAQNIPGGGISSVTPEPPTYIPDITPPAP